MSYVLVVGFAIITFATCSLITAYGFGDKQIFQWLTEDSIAMIIFKRWFMRLSRMIG